MEIDPVQTAIEWTSARFLVAVCWGSLPSGYRSATVNAERQKLDAEMVEESLQRRAGQSDQAAR
jgi:hypothetical protein